MRETAPKKQIIDKEITKQLEAAVAKFGLDNKFRGKLEDIARELDYTSYSVFNDILPAFIDYKQKLGKKLNVEDFTEYFEAIKNCFGVSSMYVHFTRYALPAFLNLKASLGVEISGKELKHATDKIREIALLSRGNGNTLLQNSFTEYFKTKSELKQDVTEEEWQMFIDAGRLLKNEVDSIIETLVPSLLKAKHKLGINLTNEELKKYCDIFVNYKAVGYPISNGMLVFVVPIFFQHKASFGKDVSHEELSKFLEQLYVLLTTSFKFETGPMPTIYAAYPLLQLIKSKMEIGQELSQEEIFNFARIVAEVAGSSYKITANRLIKNSFSGLFASRKEISISEFQEIADLVNKVKNDIGEPTYKEKVIFLIGKFFKTGIDFNLVLSIVTKSFRRELSNVDLAYRVFNSKLDPTENKNPLLRLFFKYCSLHMSENKNALISFLNFLDIVTIFDPSGLSFMSVHQQFAKLLGKQSFVKAVRILENPNRIIGDKDIGEHISITNLLPENTINQKLEEKISTFVNNKEARKNPKLGKEILKEVVSAWLDVFKGEIAKVLLKISKMELGIKEEEIEKYDPLKMQEPIFLTALKIYKANLDKFQYNTFGIENLKGFLRAMVMSSPNAVEEYVKNLPGNVAFINKLKANGVTEEQIQVWQDQNKREYSLEIKPYTQADFQKDVVAALKNFIKVANQMGAKMEYPTDKELFDDYEKYLDKFRELCSGDKKNEEVRKFTSSLAIKDPNKLRRFLREDLLIQLNPIYEAQRNFKKQQNGSVEKISIHLENDRREVLKMGSYFTNSCLHPDKVNAWGVFANALDINKRILWVKNEKGEVLSRVLIGLVNEKNGLAICRYSVYGDAKYEPIIIEYLSELSSENKLSCTHTTQNPASLNSIPFYDDGTV